MAERYTFKTLFEQIKMQKGNFWRVNFYGILTTLLLLPLPMLIPLLIDEILLDHPGKITALMTALFGATPEWVYIAVILVVVITMRFMAFLTNNKKNMYAAKVTQRVNYQLRHRILTHLEHVSLGEYESLKAGGIASKTVNDVESIGYFSEMMTTQFLSALLMSMGVVAIMLWMKMIAFLFYLSTMAGPIQQLMGLVLSYQNTKPALDRINQMLSLDKEPNYPQLLDPFKEAVTSSIELKNISFAYGNGIEVLHNISLIAKAGQKIALIGPSGSGKTTVAQMMVGFYPVHSGEILYDGIPIEQIGLPVIRGNVALMLQQSLFFNDTIRMNLTLSKPKNDEEIYEALRAAQLDEFIRKLEEGLDTRIGKNGIRLSGGQRQRLAIARLILSDPKIVIFDEATSAMDNATEFYLYDTLKTFLQWRTTIIIAHRTTTIKQADYIYLIRAGEVAAEGTFEEMESWRVIQEDFDGG